MRVTILALGSRGDVQPFIALGLRLQAEGYDVCLAAIDDYADLVRQYNLAFAPLIGSARVLANPDAIQVALRGGPHKLARYFFREVEPLAERLLHDCWQAARNSDMLVVSTLAMYPALHLVEKWQIPWMVAHFHPYSPLAIEPHGSFPRALRVVPGYNHFTYTLVDHVFAQLLRGAFNRVRQRSLGLPPLSPWAMWQRTQQPMALFGFSGTVVSDLQAHPHVTGYWFTQRPSGWQPPTALVDFLRAGPPPVMISFGSMMFGKRGQAITTTLVEALTRSQQRGLIFCGWGDLAQMALPSTVMAVNEIPHDWLLPQVKAIIHHGGAGVTAAALRYGVPSITIPFLGDQLFWGERVAALGAGLRQLPRRHFNVQSLSHAIDMVCRQTQFRYHAVRIGQQLACEDGVESAFMLLKQTVKG